MKIVGLLFFCVLAFAEDTKSDEKQSELIVELPLLGKVSGSIIKSRLNKDILSFRGVRYGEPPTGQQRFKQAIPVKPWTGIFNASEEGPSCPRPDRKFQSEDCLRLNVYTTKLASSSDSSSTLRPVIVFFHPGGFYGVSGQSIYFGPQYLLDEEVVLVTVNYRLASLGFLSTGDSLAPGNLGLKDQVEALRWVQKNINNFGGDPNCVTIMGYSAGGWSVTLHMVSPMSKGLFHRAIAMSGAVTYQNLLPTDQKDLAKKQAEILGCPTDTTGNMLICLNTKTEKEIADTLSQFFEWNKDPILIWLPVVEPEVPGVERFLPAQPIDLIREGKFHQVPLITGITRDEFGSAVVDAVEAARKGETADFDSVNENWTTIAPISFFYERNTTQSLEISSKLKHFYLHDKPIGLDNYEGWARLYADGVIGFSVHRFANLVSDQYKTTNTPVYYYEFTYQGRYSHKTWSDGKPYGVVHHDDLLYLFYVSFFPYFDAEAPEIKAVKRSTAMWVNFAKTGEPIPKDRDEFKNITWTPFTKENKAYLEIGNELIMKSGLNEERMNEWDKMFPLPDLNRPENNSK
uniref:Carboxylic ester hydrolase n=1 Tax=Meteorus pulchricornis TaxID=51522 RepID=A0A4D6J7H8_9HYME|nr:carboxylesterase 3 [Meteorus pulchricornis]